MKKALCLLLALVFVLGLCACGSEDYPDTPTVSNTLSTPTEPPAVGSEYVGNWVATRSGGYDGSSFIHFFSNGQAIFGYGGGTDDVDSAYAGQWFTEGNKIYLTYTDDGTSRAYIFTICDGYIEGCDVESPIYTLQYYKVN